MIKGTNKQKTGEIEFDLCADRSVKMQVYDVIIHNVITKPNETYLCKLSFHLSAARPAGHMKSCTHI